MNERAIAIKNMVPFIRNTPLSYLDNAATTHMPESAITMQSLYTTELHAPVNRSLYTSAEAITTAYEAVREQVALLLNAHSSADIIFSYNATDSIAMVAYAWAINNIHENDIILVSPLEHHANLLIWQHIAHLKKAQLAFLPISPEYTLDMAACQAMIRAPVKLIAVTHTSNVLGTWINIKKLAHYAHAIGARILVDACQSAPRITLDVQDLDIDFLVFSAHKMMGPTGVGILYCAPSTHGELIPYRYGGNMVHTASFNTASYAPMPRLLEAGTPNSLGVITFGAVLEYQKENLDKEWLVKHESDLCRMIHAGLSLHSEITILTRLEHYPCHIVTFVVQDIHAHDIAAALSCYNVAVRAGNHCAQPLHTLMGYTATVRVSVYAYTTHEDIERFLSAMEHVMHYFRKERLIMSPYLPRPKAQNPLAQ